MVPYLRSGEVPPFWKELVAHGTVRFTPEKFSLDDTWELPNDDTTLATVSLVQLDNGSTDSMNENEGPDPDLPILDAPPIPVPPEPPDT
eukprot:7777630-Ditylum_brightwellii.AAC.1